MDAQAAQQIDIDELARDKVQEIENLLESSNINIKFQAVDLWFSVLKQIITAADLHRTNDKNGNVEDTKVDESIYADYADDNEQFNSVDLTEQFATNSVKWTIRVKAFKLVHRLVQLPANTSKSLPLRHLPDLVRLSFVAATSPYDDLKTQGFEMFKFLINRFASVEEKEFPGHSILEQYRTQVLSALKPAFNLDAPPYITAIASQVCCLWISKGLERDSVNLKRTYQLMTLTIDKLENQSINQNSKLYTESELEQERLDILGSWAHLYIASRETVEDTLHGTRNRSDDLYTLVRPQIATLVDKWWEALKDYALLIMPAARIMSTSHDNEHVYTRDVALRLFAPNWYKLILASTSWLCIECSSTLETNHSTSNPSDHQKTDDSDQAKTCDKSNISPTRNNEMKYVKFVCGILMKELCTCHSDDLAQRESLAESTLFAIRSLTLLVDNKKLQSTLSENIAVVQEFYTILYSILFVSTRLKYQHQLLLKKLLEQLFRLGLGKVSENPLNINYGLAYYIKTISQNLSFIEEELKEVSDDKSKLEKLKSNLTIYTRSILCIMRIAPGDILTEHDLQESFVDVFRKLVCFKEDLTISLSSLDLLKELLDLQEELKSVFISDILKAQVNMSCELLNLICSEESAEKRTHLVSCLETYLRSSRSYIAASGESDDGTALMAFFTTTLLHELIELTSAKPANQEKPSIGQNIILTLVIKHTDELAKDHPEVYAKALDSDTKQMLDLAIKKLQDLKQENESRRNTKANDKQTGATGKTGPSKPANKITLRADFSNFYAKKT